LITSLFLSSPSFASAADKVVADPGDSGSANQLRARLAARQNTGGGKLTFNVGIATIVL